MIVELYTVQKKPASEIEREYGVSNASIYKWIEEYSPIKTEDGTVTNSKEIKKLKKGISSSQRRIRNTKKSDCHIHAKIEDKINFINKYKSWPKSRY